MKLALIQETRLASRLNAESSFSARATKASASAAVGAAGAGARFCAAAGAVGAGRPQSGASTNIQRALRIIGGPYGSREERLRAPRHSVKRRGSRRSPDPARAE